MLIVRTTPSFVVFFITEYLPRNTQEIEGKECRTSWWVLGEERKEPARDKT